MNTSCKENLRTIIKLRAKPLVVSAGMPRSGSTLLFNIIREILKVEFGSKLASAWEADVQDLESGEAFLIKTHRVSRLLRFRAQHIFYSYRDVRVAAVSAMRRFEIPISLEWMRAEVEEYRKAKEVSRLIFQYEVLRNDPLLIVNQISRSLDIQVDAEEIVSSALCLHPPTSSGYSKISLLHNDHMTHTEDEEWREVFPAVLVEQVNNELSWWFRECGYPLN